MDINWKCDGCGKPLVTDSKYTWAKVECPRCKKALLVPASQTLEAGKKSTEPRPQAEEVLRELLAKYAKSTDGFIFEVRDYLIEKWIIFATIGLAALVALWLFVGVTTMVPLAVVMVIPLVMPSLISLCGRLIVSKGLRDLEAKLEEPKKQIAILLAALRRKLPSYSSSGGPTSLRCWDFAHSFGYEVALTEEQKIRERWEKIEKGWGYVKSGEKVSKGLLRELFSEDPDRLLETIRNAGIEKQCSALGEIALAPQAKSGDEWAMSLLREGGEQVSRELLQCFEDQSCNISFQKLEKFVSEVARFQTELLMEAKDNRQQNIKRKEEEAKKREQQEIMRREEVETIRKKILTMLSPTNTSLVDPRDIVKLGVGAVEAAIDVFKNPTTSYGTVNQAMLAAALVQFAQQGNEEAADFLANVADGDVPVSGPNGKEALTIISYSAIKNSDPHMRMCGARGLGNLKDEGAVGALINLLNDKASFVRRDAAAALGVIGDARAVGPLIEMVKDCEEHVFRDVDEEESAVEALGKIADRRAVEPLINILEKKLKQPYGGTGHLPILLLEALTKIGDPRARKVFHTAQRSKNSSMSLQEKAERAIRELEERGEKEQQRREWKSEEIRPREQTAGALPKREKKAMTSILDAAREGDRGAIEQLLTQGADVNVRDDADYTPLHWAIENGHKDVVELLLSKDVDVNAKSIYGHTPLHMAAVKGHRGLANLLLSKGANLNAKADEGQTPLCLAAFKSHEEVVDLLISKGADVNVKQMNSNDTPLHIAARGRNTKVVELLLSSGATVNAKNTVGWTPLHEAVDHSQKAVAEVLLAKGADVNSKDMGGKTPLWWALCKGDEPLAQLLQTKGGTEGKWPSVCADCDKADPRGAYIQRADGRRRCQACASRIGLLTDFD